MSLTALHDIKSLFLEAFYSLGIAIYNGNYSEGMVRVAGGVLEILPLHMYPHIKVNPNHLHNIVLEKDVFGNEILYRTMSQADFAVTGQVEKLNDYLESFKQGDRLGFVPYIKQDYIERALEIAKENS